MIVTTIASTYGNHSHIGQLRGGDLLIHAGDFTEYGASSDVESFLKWFRDQPYIRKIFIAGNHEDSFDVGLSVNWEYSNYEWLSELLGDYKVNHEDGDMDYLENSGTEMWGLKIWGSPYTPHYSTQFEGFTCKRDNMFQIWAGAPLDTDILVTHCNPAYKGDYDCRLERTIGCKYLRQHIKAHPPVVHVSGHCIDGHGVLADENTIFINSAMSNSTNLDIVHKPHTFTIDEETKQVEFV